MSELVASKSHELESEIELLQAAFGECVIIKPGGSNIEFNSGGSALVLNTSSYPQSLAVSMNLCSRTATKEIERELRAELLELHTSLEGEPSLFALVSAFSARLEELEEGEKAGRKAPTLGTEDTQTVSVGTRTAEARAEMQISLIYFHHIMAAGKKKFIAEESRALGVGGVWVSGFPGCVVCEGERSSVVEFISKLKSLNWQEIRVRGEIISTLCGTVDSARLFSPSLVKVEALSDVARACKEAGVEDLYFTLRKN